MTEEQTFRHIVRIANVDLPGNKRLEVALTAIKGVGMNFAHVLCTVAGVDKHLKAGYLHDQQIAALNKAATTFEGIPTWLYNHQKEYDSGQDKHLITGTLMFAQDNDLKRMKRMKSYKGVRHIRGLPVRGQRTKSNFRKNKGKVVGVAKKKAEAAAAKEKDKGSKEKGAK